MILKFNGRRDIAEVDIKIDDLIFIEDFDLSQVSDGTVLRDKTDKVFVVFNGKGIECCLDKHGGE